MRLKIINHELHLNFTIFPLIYCSSYCTLNSLSLHSLYLCVEDRLFFFSQHLNFTQHLIFLIFLIFPIFFSFLIFLQHLIFMIKKEEENTES